MRRRLLLVALVPGLLASLAACDVVRGNPYDATTTPPVEQAPASLSGTLVVSGCPSAASVDVVLLREGRVAASTTTLLAGDGNADGAFRFTDVVPGRYELQVRREGVPAGTGRVLDLIAGDDVDLGRVSVSPSTSSVSGALSLADAASADGTNVVVSGHALACGDGVVVTRLAVVQGGRFDIAELPAGTWDLFAQKAGYTIDREPALPVLPTSTGELPVVVPLNRELVLHPASAVVHVVDDVGAPLRFTNRRTVSLEVLGFGGLSEMRVSTDATAFDDPDAGWTSYAATVSDFDLGDVDGPVVVYAQLRDGALVSDRYSASVVLDRQAPVITSLLVDGDAPFLRGATGGVRLVADDDGAGIAGFDAAVSALSGSFVQLASSTGFPAHLERTETLTFAQGGLVVDGNYEVHARVIDGAGNVSDEVVDTIARDTTPPSAPQGLVVVDGSPTSSDQPAFVWSSSSDAATSAPRYTVELSRSATFASIALRDDVDATTFVPAQPLADGTYFWRVTARDDAGNAATTTADGPVVVDTTPPSIVTLQPIASPAPAPLVLSWTTPIDADRAGVRLQVSTSPDFAPLLVDSLETSSSRDVSALVPTGPLLFVRVAGEDVVGNRLFASATQLVFDADAPAIAASPIVIESVDGTALVDDSLVLDRNVTLRLSAGVAGEHVIARVSNNADCSAATSFSLDQPGTANNRVAWVLSSGSAFKQAFVRFVDDAGNASPCVASQRLRSTGTLRGTVDVQAGASGLSIGSNERAGVVITITGSDAALPMTTASGPDGSWSLAGVPVDVGGASFAVSFAKNGFRSPASVPARVRADEAVVVATPVVTVDAGRVSGRVDVRETTQAIGACTGVSVDATGVVVSLEGSAFTGEFITRTTTTAADGSYSLLNIPAGSYTASAARAGYATTSTPPLPLGVPAGSSLVGQDFVLDDRIAPTAALLRLVGPVLTSAASVTIAIDLPSTDASQPGSNFAGYEVERVTPTDSSTNGGTSGGASGGRASFGIFPPSNALVGLTLQEGVPNRFIITPLDCAGDRGPSSEISVTRDSSPPGQVTNLHADNRDGAVVLTWNASVDSDVVGYRVYYGAVDSANASDFTGAFAAQGVSPLAVSASGAPSLTMSGLLDGTTFFAAVTAVDAAGNESVPLSERVIAAPSRMPIDVRAEFDIASTCASSSFNDEIPGHLAANDRLVTVATAVPGVGFQVYRHDARDELTLVGDVKEEQRAGLQLFGDFAIVYSDQGASGSSRAYDLRDPSSPRLVASTDAFDSCNKCVFRAISNEGFAPLDGVQPIMYAAAYRDSSGVEQVGLWRRDPTERGLFHRVSGAIVNVGDGEAARGLVQAGEFVFVLRASSVETLRIDPAGGLEFMRRTNLVGQVSFLGGQAAFSTPYLYVPTQAGLEVFLVTPGDRTAPAGASSVSVSPIARAPSLIEGGPQAILPAGVRLVAVGAAGHEQRIVETYEQAGLSTARQVAERTGPTALGQLYLRADNPLSVLTMRNAALLGNHVVALFHWNGSPLGGCTDTTTRRLQLKIFELGSPATLAQGVRIPRLLAQTAGMRTAFTDLRGGILTTTEVGAGKVLVSSYDLRDPQVPTLMGTSTPVSASETTFFTGATSIAGAAARNGHYIFASIATPAPTRAIAVFDVSFADRIRLVAAGSSLPMTALAPENITQMEIVNDTAYASLADNLNETVNKNYFASFPVDVPAALPPWSFVADASATSGMAGLGVVVDGTTAWVAAHDHPGSAGSLSLGRLCAVDLASSSTSGPAHVRCVATQTGSSAPTFRTFAAAGTPGFIHIGSDAGYQSYDIRQGIPTGPIDSVARFTPPAGVALSMSSAGPFLYTSLGNSSNLPLGATLGFDASIAANDAGALTLVGSLNDADSGFPGTRISVSGDVLIVPSKSAGHVATLVQLY